MPTQEQYIRKTKSETMREIANNEAREKEMTQFCYRYVTHRLNRSYLIDLFLQGLSLVHFPRQPRWSRFEQPWQASVLIRCALDDHPGYSLCRQEDLRHSVTIEPRNHQLSVFVRNMPNMGK